MFPWKTRKPCLNRPIFSLFTCSASAAARVWPELAENEPAAVLTNVDVLLRALTAKACVPNCNPSVLMKVCMSVCVSDEWQ